MSSYKNRRPPPYRYGSRQHSNRDMHEEEYLHFYSWTSPPGVIKIVCIIIIILSVAIFACVGSTLAWDTDMEMSGIGNFGAGLGGNMYMGGYGSNYGGSYGSYGTGGYGYGTGGYGYGGIGGNYTSPRAGKGFIIAIAAFSFIAGLIIFITVVSRKKVARSRQFYLAVIIISAILAVFMLISTIVYLVAINPAAQASGSVYYSQVISLCSQYQSPQQSAIFINQYLYHYCVVTAEEAVAVVFGFLVTIGLVIIAIFAGRTRQKIWRYGRNILWEEMKVVNDGLHRDVGEWVNTVSGEPEHMLNAYPDVIRGSRDMEDVSADHCKPPYSPIESRQTWSPDPYSTESVATSSIGKAKISLQRSDTLEDTDYATGAETGEELDNSNFVSEFPPISNEQKRQEYKREFDRDHKEYRILQAELDDIKTGLLEADHELYNVQQRSPQHMDAMDEYNRLKSLKKSADYQMKKQKCKYLKAKLSHIKKMVNDYDGRV